MVILRSRSGSLDLARGVLAGRRTLPGVLLPSVWLMKGLSGSARRDVLRALSRLERKIRDFGLFVRH